jgi:transcription factor CP2-like protein
VYHALYLEHLTSQELLEKLAKLYNVASSEIGELYCEGPEGIYILLNDEVIQNMSEQSRFCVEAMKCKPRSSVVTVNVLTFVTVNVLTCT